MSEPTSPAGVPRYLCISDLHLAASNSLLTTLTPDNLRSVPEATSPALRALADCLRAVARLAPADAPPTLIFNGDILELALAGTSQASMNFIRFMEALATDGQGRPDFPFANEIFYLPGNHDHHVWNTARETRYIGNYIAGIPADARGHALEPEYQATRMFRDARLHPVPAFLPNTLMQGRAATDPLSAVQFSTVYPNFGLLDPTGTRAVLIHHGHYVEPIYRLMSGLKDVFFPNRQQPEAIWDLEAENGAWVDFFWSTLGRSGAVGQDVELIYDKMQDQAKFDQLLDRLAGALALRVLPGWTWCDGPKRAALRLILRHLAAGHFDQREVQQSDEVLSTKSQAGLTRYVVENLQPEVLRGNDGSVPAKVTFLFGHTHKPFERALNFAGYPGPVDVFNSGGWVADTLGPEPLHGGAILVVDDSFEVASVRVYQEIAGGGSDAVGVHTLPTQGQALAERLRESIRAEPAPWEAFSTAVCAALPAHRTNLKAKVDA